MTRLLCLLAATFAWISEAQALQLGDATLESHLGQPLKVLIPIDDPRPLQAEDVIVRLGDASEHQARGIDKADLPERLKVLVSPASTGDGLQVLITTPQPVADPVVSFLLVVESPSAELMKTYTVLMDLP